jgi:hypothetical protein
MSCSSQMRLAIASETASEQLRDALLCLRQVGRCCRLAATLCRSCATGLFGSMRVGRGLSTPSRSMPIRILGPHPF